MEEAVSASVQSSLGRVLANAGEMGIECLKELGGADLEFWRDRLRGLVRRERRLGGGLSGSFGFGCVDESGAG